MRKLLFPIFIILLFCSCNDSHLDGHINGNIYTSTIHVNMDAGQSLLFGVADSYSFIIEDIWKECKANPSIEIADINMIITGNDGYGKTSTINWLHLVFKGALLNEIKRYETLDIGNNPSWNEIGTWLDIAGLSKLKDYKGDLSKEAFD
jgi:hypothetical protein